MSAAEMVTPLTTASGGDAEFMDGAGVGCGVGTGVGVPAGFAVVGLEPGRRVCADAKLNSRTALNTARAILGKIIRASFLSRVNLSTGAGEPAHSFERINLVRLLVGSQPDDAWKPQSIATLVTLGWLDSVKGYFQNNQRLDHAHASVGELLESVRAKPFGHLGDFRVSQSRISLADVEQLRLGFRPSHCKGVIRQDVPPLTMPEFHRGDHDIERRQGFLQFHPFAPAAAGFV